MEFIAKTTALILFSCPVLCAQQLPRPDGTGSRFTDRFKQLDRNGDGKVSREEAGSLPFFDAADKNKDGSLTIEEPQAYFAARRVARPAASEQPSTPLAAGELTAVAAGLRIPATMQGCDLQPVLRDAKAPGRTDWYYEHDCDTKTEGRPLPRCEDVRTDRWKYIRYKDTQPVQEELFDLQNDPFEERNLAKDATPARTLAQMSARCDELRKSLR